MKQPLQILIVDDSSEDAEHLVAALDQDFSVTYQRVQDAQEMREALKAQEWDLVVSDHMMPRFNGLAALQTLQHSGLDLPFIMVSAQAGEELAVEAMRAGARDYLIKEDLSRLGPAIKRELKEAAVRRESRQAQNALYATEARFQSLVELSLVGIFLLCGERFSYVNPKFAQLFGFTQDDLIDRKGLMELVEQEDQLPVLMQFLRPLRDLSANQHLFFRGRRKDGRIIELEVNGTRTWHDGKDAIIGTVLDITDRKHAEQQLSKLWQAVEQSPVGVVTTDCKGSIEYVNPKFQELTGYDEQELVGQNPRILKSGNMEPSFYQQMWRTISAGQEWHGEVQNKRKNGELYWVRESVSAVKDAEGRTTHFVAVIEDITEKKRAVDQVRQAQKMEAIGQLAGGVAHDFNNLLTIINGYGALLAKELEPGTTLHREAEQIVRAGERAADLTRQLLSFSRRQILEPKVLKLNEQVKSIEKMLRRLIGENIELVTELAEDIGLIKMDPGQVEQVIMNLVVNARDASETGGLITVATANCELDHHFTIAHAGSVAGSYVRLSVSDRGFGMTDEVKRRVFEPFFTTKEMGRGTGLGLATVYGIVKQSGGYIELISAPDQGATFNIYLPRVFEEPEALKPQPPEEQVEGTQTILVVEDEPGVLNLVVQTLKKRGFRVLETTDPQHGVAIFEENADTIDMLLTDVVMPFMSGPTLAEILTKKNPQLKVLFMSGHADNRAGLEKVLERGVAFLPKPFAGDALLRKVKETLGDGAVEPALQSSGGCF